MIRLALPCAAIAAAAGAAVASCNTTDQPYRVIAVAALAPVGTQASRGPGDPLGQPITGPIEVLDDGEAEPGRFGNGAHVAAAYRVRLAPGAAPWVRVIAASSCNTPRSQVRIADDLGLIRRVGDETHFFRRHVEVRGEIMDVDTQTARLALGVGLDPMFAAQDVLGKLAVVQAPGEDALPTGQVPCPPGDPRPDCDDGSGVGSAGFPPGGEWLACGVFVAMP